MRTKCLNLGILSLVVYIICFLSNQKTGWLGYFLYYVLWIAFPILCYINSTNIKKSKNIFYILRKKYVLSYLLSGIGISTICSLIISIPIWISFSNLYRSFCLVLESLSIHLSFVLLFYGLAYYIEVKQSIIILNLGVAIMNLLIFYISGSGQLLLQANVLLDLVIFAFDGVLFVVDCYIFKQEANYDKISS